MKILKSFVCVAVWSIAVCVLGGCSTSNGLITSLEDVSTEAKKEGWVKIPQYRVVSVPGLLPFADVGGLSFYKPRRKPASAIGLSSDGQSYISETIIDSDCNEKCLICIRDELISLNTHALNLVDAKLEISRLSAQQAAQSGQTQADQAAMQAEIKAAKAGYQELRKQFYENAETVSKKLTKKGVMVYRWTTSSKKEGGLSLGKLFGISNNQEEKYGGFAVIAGLRLATLYVGSDLPAAWSTLNKQSRYKNRFQLTTYVMQAKRVIYSAEAELTELSRLKLEASYSQISNLSKTIKELDQIEINAAIARARSVANMGLISGAKRESIPVDWCEVVKGNLSHTNEWHTIFAVASYFRDLRDLAQTMPAPTINESRSPDRIVSSTIPRSCERVLTGGQ